MNEDKNNELDIKLKRLFEKEYVKDINNLLEKNDLKFGINRC